MQDVTSQTLESGILPAGAIPTGATQNLHFAPAAPPPLGVLPRGQEAAIPGTLYNPLALPTGSYLKTLPAPASPGTSAPNAAGLGASLTPPSIPNIPGAGEAALAGLLSQGVSLADILAGITGKKPLLGLGDLAAKGLKDIGLPGNLASNLGKYGLGSDISGFLTGLTQPTYGGLTQPGIVGGLESGGLDAALSTGLSFVPVVGPVLAALVPMLSSLFHGANPLQVPAAQTEQPFEAAADDVLALAKAGQISPAQAATYMQALEQAGQQQEAALEPKIGEPATKGSENLTKVINDEIAALQGIGTPTSQPLNLQSALGSFIQPGAPGWYSQTGADALTLLNQLLGTKAAFAGAA